jgi:hypothetical protein
MNYRIATLFCILLMVPDTVHGASAPRQLFGRSVVLSWSEHQVAKFSDENRIRSAQVAVYDSVYISDKGRVFSEMARKNRGSLVAHDQAPDSSKDSSGSSQSARFEGGALVVDTKFLSGAMRVVVDFDEGFKTCNAKVIHGKEDGKTMKWASWRHPGRLREVQSIEVTNLSCAVKEGNVLGGQ